MNQLAQILHNTASADCQKVSCITNTEDNLNKNVWHLYGHYFRSQGDINSYLNRPLTITETDILDLVERYRKTAANWKDVDADYLYFGPWEQQLNGGKNTVSNNLQPIYNNKLVKIYRVNH